VPAGPERVGLPEGEWVAWPPLAWRVRVRRIRGSVGRPAAKASWAVRLDGRVLEEPLALRVWRPGDRFRPAGAPGRKKLQDFFVDAKIPREVRGRLPLLLAGEAIAGVLGHRAAEEFRWTGRGAACLVEVSTLEN
jgi:tRNA(Ile)-lysidine synthase